MKDALKNLEYFIGKAVTIITTPINRDFDERQKCDYFVGIVLSVDTMGIIAQHPITGCRNYYFYSQICVISEEQVLDSVNPEHAKMIDEIKSKPSATPKTIQINSPYVDVNELNRLSGS